MRGGHSLVFAGLVIVSGTPATARGALPRTGNHGARGTAEAGAAGTYNGRAGQSAVQIPRIEETIPIDGTLSDPVWKRAALLVGFSEYSPVDGQPAEDSTEVFVWYSPTALYLGIRAFEAHGAVHVTLANRDNIGSDDHIHIIISPFIHSRQALNFAVNPLGVQSDGTITEGAAGTSGYGLTSQTGPPPTDLSPDFVWDSKGHVTPFGFEVAIRIPFRSIKFPSRNPQDWGFNVQREIHHSGETDSWYPAKLAAASYLEQVGTLQRLTGLNRGLVLDLNPFLTQKALGGPVVTPAPGWRYGVERPQIGGNVRYGVTNNLLLNGTYRPDFAEVEADATQLILDPRSAVQYPEKRPFFLDGLEQFNTPNNLIYTRAILAPVGAAKLTGKVGNVSLAYLGASDGVGSPALAGGHPLFNILRLRQDFAQGSQVGVALTDKEQGGSFNRLASADARLTFAKIYSFFVQAGGSDTRTPAGRAAGPLWQAEFTRGGRSFVMDYNLSAIDPEFVAASGFIARTGIVNGTIDYRYTFYPANSFMRTVGLDVRGNDTWVYRQFTAGHAPEDRRVKFTAFSTLSGGWQLLGGVYVETFGYDPSLYANYYLGHVGPGGTTYTPFVGTPIIPNTDYVFQLTTPFFSRFDLTLLQLGGRDENFYEWSSADVSITETTLNYRPTDKLRVQLMYNAQIYWRHSDFTQVAHRHIPRLSVEYQLSRPIFFRLIGQYDGAYQNTLRDDARTNLPIYIRNPTTGIYTPASAFQSNVFQLSGLFAYQPVPGTVAFVGYGNNLAEPDAFHFAALRREADNFFVKFSYLFSVR